MGVPISESITESYRKDVSTNFKLKKSDKRRRVEEEDEVEEKAELPAVHAISEIQPEIKELWNQVMLLKKSSDLKQGRNALPCFAFARGACKRNDCYYSHAEVPQTASSNSGAPRDAPP
jgi:hypothetical protein